MIDKVQALSMIEMAMDLNKRRDQLTKRVVLVCPKCRSRQIQLLNQEMLAKWKCRECNTEFKYEPVKHDSNHTV